MTLPTAIFFCTLYSKSKKQKFAVFNFFYFFGTNTSPRRGNVVRVSVTFLKRTLKRSYRELKNGSRQVNLTADRQASRQASRQAGRQAGWQASRQAGRQAGRQASKHASRQAGKHRSSQECTEAGR